jgi:uncharacterized membrane protein
MKNQVLKIFTGLISIWFFLLSCGTSEKEKKEIQQKCDSTQIIPSLSFSIKDDSISNISMVIIKEKNNTNTVDSFSVLLVKAGKYPKAALQGSIRKPVNISHSYEFFINQKLAFIISDFRLGLTEHRNNFNSSLYGCELLEYKLNGKKMAGSSLELK